MGFEQERGHVLATCDERAVYCRVVGLGNMNNCAPFQRFALRMQERGCREFILDFSACDGLDSTFLGVLLGIAIGNRSQRTRVVVLNPSVTVRRVLEEVGLDHLLEVSAETVALPDIPLEKLIPEETTADQRIGMVLEAHENLCRIEGENRRRFGEFLRLLRSELTSRKSAAAAQEAASASGAATAPAARSPVKKSVAGGNEGAQGGRD
ncbi:MAG: STAS domain-containing protein [Planctomycetes bacterium]|nr:STAS domain-containing protein [Planctomycetota bacterium]